MMGRGQRVDRRGVIDIRYSSDIDEMCSLWGQFQEAIVARGTMNENYILSENARRWRRAQTTGRYYDPYSADKQRPSHLRLRACLDYQMLPGHMRHLAVDEGCVSCSTIDVECEDVDVTELCPPRDYSMDVITTFLARRPRRVKAALKILPEEMDTHQKRIELAEFIQTEYFGRRFGRYDCIRRDPRRGFKVVSMRPSVRRQKPSPINDTLDDDKPLPTRRRKLLSSRNASDGKRHQHVRDRRQSPMYETPDRREPPHVKAKKLSHVDVSIGDKERSCVRKKKQPHIMETPARRKRTFQISSDERDSDLEV